MSAAVYLIGAGPGDPQLVTLRAVEVLSRADVVLYDYLVNPAITAHAPVTARRVCLGQHGRSRIWTQREINEEMVRCALAGQNVARLKGGDPSIFGRLMEEVECLTDAGIPFEIIPGISAASAASAHAGIPLTNRQCASGVAFVTGHESADDAQGRLDFASLAGFPGTLVVYMGVTTAARWVGQLMEYGKSADTPVALVRRCSFPDQRIIRCRLADVPDRLIPYHKFPPPVIAIIGEVAVQQFPTHQPRLRPLWGRVVLITRSLEQQAAATAEFERLGAQVVQHPVIQTRPASDRRPLLEAIAQIDRFEWIVFCSSNGVRYFFRALADAGLDTRHLAHNRIAAIGSSTAQQLEQHGINADLIPETFRAEEFGDALRERVRGQSVLLIRANRGRSVLPEQLAKSACRVCEVVAYLSEDIEVADAATCELLRDGKVDWTIVMSSASAQALVKLFGNLLQHTRLASISPVTSSTLTELGYTPIVEAKEYTLAGIGQAICDWHPTQVT